MGLKNKKGKAMNIKDNVREIVANIEKAKADSPISAVKVSLLAASKVQDASAIEEAIAAGITCFGENRVQEAR